MRRRRNSQTQDDSVYEEPGTQSATIGDLSSVERETLVGNLMRLVLFADLHKQIVTKRDITTKVIKEYATKRRVTNEIIEEARKRFLDTFGFEWKELPKTVTQKTGGITKKVIDHSAKSGKFILINKLSNTDHEVLRDDKGPYVGLLMVVLSLIHLNNNALEQETLYALLKNLGLEESNPASSPIPQWVDTIERKFVKQLYLEKEKISDRVDSNGKEVYLYRIGARSKIEISTIQIVKFIADVFGESLTEIQLKEAQDLSDESMEEEDSE